MQQPWDSIFFFLPANLVLCVGTVQAGATAITGAGRRWSILSARAARKRGETAVRRPARLWRGSLWDCGMTAVDEATEREKERERDQRDRLQEPWLSPSWCPRRLVGEENTDTVVGRCVCVRAYSAMVVTSYKTSTNRCKKPTPLRYSRFIGFNGIIYRRSRWTEPITPRTTNENSNVQNTHTHTQKKRITKKLHVPKNTKTATRGGYTSCAARPSSCPL